MAMLGLHDSMAMLDNAMLLRYHPSIWYLDVILEDREFFLSLHFGTYCAPYHLLCSSSRVLLLSIMRVAFPYPLEGLGPYLASGAIDFLAGAIDFLSRC